jgi:hypothetical protein
LCIRLSDYGYRTIRHKRLSDYGYWTDIYFCFPTWNVGAGLANSDTSILSIGYRIHNKLSDHRMLTHCSALVLATTSRVRRSYSLKAKISENKRKCGDFRSRFEAKKSVFFRFVRMQAKHSKQRKKLKRNESKAKRETKNYNSSNSLKVSL